MAFQLKKTQQRAGKVTVSYPDPDKVGVEKQDSFEAKFEIVSQPEFERIQADIDEGDSTVRETLERVFTGVNGEFLDFDGKPIADFSAIKTGLLSESNYVTALWRTWTSLQRTVKQKNSKK